MVRINTVTKINQDIENPGYTDSSTLLSRWQRLRPHVLAIGFYCLLTMWLAWPSLGSLGVGTFGELDIDRNQNMWNMWWFKHSLFDTHSNLFVTNYLYYPFGVKLFLHTLSPFTLVLALPFYLTVGPIVAFNILMLVSIPISAYAAYVLARYLLPIRLGREWGALIAGVVWGFGPYRFAMIRAEWINLAWMQWIPLFILFVIKLERSQTRRALLINGSVAVLVYLLSLLTDYYYSLFLLLFCTLYWLWRGGQFLWASRPKSARQEQGRAWRGLTIKLAGVFGLAFVIYSPIIWGTAIEITSDAYAPLGRGTDFNNHSTDLLQLFLPPGNQPWWGRNFGLWSALGINGLNISGAVLSYSVLALAVVGLVKYRQTGLWFWVASAVIWLILSLGGVLRFNTLNTGVPLPGKIINQLPLFNIIRFTERYMVMVFLSLSLLAAFGLAYLIERSPSRKLAGRLSLKSVVGSLVLLLVFVEASPGFIKSPLPITVPAFTKVVAASNSSSGVNPSKAILELPITKHNAQDAPRMFYQIYHERPIVGGYTSREPIDPYRNGNSPLNEWVDPQADKPDILPARDQATMVGLLNYLNIGYIVQYPADYQRDNQRRDATLAMINRVLGTSGQPAKPLYQDVMATVYQVPFGQLTQPTLLLGQGWQPAELADSRLKTYQRWITDDITESVIMVVVNPQTRLAGQYTLDLKLATPDKPRHLAISLNSQPIDTLLVSSVKEFKLNIHLQPGTNLIKLKADPAEGYFVPAKAGGDPQDNRKLRLAVLGVQLDDVN